MDGQTETYIQAYIHTYARLHIYTQYIYNIIHTDIQMRSLHCTHTHTPTNISTHIYTYTYIHTYTHECIHSRTRIHSGHFYSASSSPLLLRVAPDTARILCQNFTSKRHRQL